MKKYLTPILIVILIVGGMLGASCSKPDVYETALKELDEAQGRLGEVDEQGRFYTLREFSYDIDRLTEPLPDDWITEEMGFSELVIFYKQSEASWEEYSHLRMDMESLIASIAEELYGSDTYWLAESLWDEYDRLPSKPTSVRTKYRSNHSEVEARLLFWAKVSKSVFYKGTPEGDEVVRLLSDMFGSYGITKRMHPRWAQWGM